MKSEKEIWEDIGKIEEEKKFANSEDSNCHWTRAEEQVLQTLYWVLR